MAKQKSNRTKTVSASPKKKRVSNPKKKQQVKYILIGLGGLVVIGGGGYAFYKWWQSKQGGGTDEAFPTASNFNPNTSNNPLPAQLPVSTATFPLGKDAAVKKPEVQILQQALIDRYGPSILPKYGADGYWGEETDTALRSKGLPTVIGDAAQFQKVLSQISSQTGFDARALANELHSVLRSSIENKIGVLRKIKAPEQYHAANEAFKSRRINNVRYTIVNAMLGFTPNEPDKERIRGEFLRMGLLYDGSKWSLPVSLSGVSRQIMTVKTTPIWDKNENVIEVPPNMVLGNETATRYDGITAFRTIDGNALFVHSNAVAYV